MGQETKSLGTSVNVDSTARSNDVENREGAISMKTVPVMKAAESPDAIDNEEGVAITMVPYTFQIIEFSTLTM